MVTVPMRGERILHQFGIRTEVIPIYLAAGLLDTGWDALHESD